MPSPDLRLCVDAGPAGADAVLVDDDDRALATARLPAGADVGEVVGAAIRSVLASSGAAPEHLTRAGIGASHAMSSALERRAVGRVAVIRIGAPLPGALPPLCLWPPELRRAVSAGERVVRGGADHTGREVAPIDEDEVSRFLQEIAGATEAVAICGVFSTVAADQELAVVDLVRRELGGGVPVSMSHEIGSLGLLGRENATVLNAALAGAAEALRASLDATLAAERVDADLFLAQNDGSVTAIEQAMRSPVLMIGSGDAACIVGAAHLSGLRDALVVSVGPAATTIGVLVAGRLPEAEVPPSLEGVRVDLRIPEVVRLPIGSASDDGGEALSHALGDALARSRKRELVPLVAVGEAGALVADGLPGVGEVMRPADGQTATAIGIAVAPVSGRAEVICADRAVERGLAVADARAAATERAVRGGADPRRVEVVELVQQPLTHMLDPTVRIRVTVAGPQF